ncbi:hypothetical protein Agub_g14002 [Astrephomene gubernaculifera]|uniref:Guanylate cyclase domain-containing protein n=1 Tax=Astrephomene gubernaculifera TaxID=47775 RepID=A0AAD3E0R2_9CHLO|nr:hypothetical protein Agub_g14002 [Astrephomene gubernaculifera]
MAAGCFNWYRKSKNSSRGHTQPSRAEFSSAKALSTERGEQCPPSISPPHGIKTPEDGATHPSGVHAHTIRTGVVSLRDPISLRDSLILSSTPEIVTIVTQSGYKCLYQNPASIAWLGSCVELEGVSEDGSVGILVDAQPKVSADNNVLNAIFAYDMEKLYIMLEEVVMGEGVWKGVIRVQAQSQDTQGHAPATCGSAGRAAGECQLPLTPSGISLHAGVSCDGTGTSSLRTSRPKSLAPFFQSESSCPQHAGGSAAAGGEFGGKPAAIASTPGMVPSTEGRAQAGFELSGLDVLDAAALALPGGDGSSLMSDKGWGDSDLAAITEPRRRSLERPAAAGSNTSMSVGAASPDGYEPRSIQRPRSAVCIPLTAGTSTRLGPQRRSFCLPNTHHSQGSLSPIPSSSMLPILHCPQVDAMQAPHPPPVLLQLLGSGQPTHRGLQDSGAIMVLSTTACEEADNNDDPALTMVTRPVTRSLRPSSEPLGAVRPLAPLPPPAPRVLSRQGLVQPAANAEGTGMPRDSDGGSSAYSGSLAVCAIGTPSPLDGNGGGGSAVPGSGGSAANSGRGGGGTRDADQGSGGNTGGSSAGGGGRDYRGRSGGGASDCAAANYSGEIACSSSGGGSRSRSSFRAMLGRILSRSIRDLGGGGGRTGSVSPASLTCVGDSGAVAAASLTASPRASFVTSVGCYECDAATKCDLTPPQPRRDAAAHSPPPPLSSQTSATQAHTPRVRISASRPVDLEVDGALRQPSQGRLPVRRIQSSRPFRAAVASSSGAPAAEGVVTSWFAQESADSATAAPVRPSTLTGLVTASRPSLSGRSLHASRSFIVSSSPASVTPLPMPSFSHAVAFAGSLRAAPTAALALAVGTSSAKRRSSLASEGANAGVYEGARTAGGNGGSGVYGIGGMSCSSSGTASGTTVSDVVKLSGANAVQASEQTPPRHRLSRVGVEGGELGAAACRAVVPQATVAPQSLGSVMELPSSPFATEAAAAAVISSSSFAFRAHFDTNDGHLPSSGPAAAVSAASAASAGQSQAATAPPQLASVYRTTSLAAASQGGGGRGGAPPVITTVEMLSRKMSSLLESVTPFGECGAAVAEGAAGEVAAGQQQEVYHEVWARRAVDPILDEDVIIITQQDVTARVLAERHLGLVMETEHRLLEQLYPRHILKGIVEDWATEFSQKQAGGAPSQMRPGVRDPYSVATWHPRVTLLFADVVGFTPMCKEVEPRAVMHMLNALFSRFDSRLDEFGVFKVETIGDCYFVAGGLVDTDEDGMANVCKRDGTVNASRDVRRVFGFAKEMLAAAREVKMPTTGQPVKIRIGMHTGPVVSGVVGTRMPRFCLFGDTVNTASRMESTGVPCSIHVSEATYVFLQNEEGWQPTGGIEVKGKGHMKTYINSPRVP